MIRGSAQRPDLVGVPNKVGSVRPRSWPTAGVIWWDAASDDLVWSAPALALLGHSTRPAAAGLDLMLDHVVPDERDRAATTMAQFGRTHSEAVTAVHTMVPLGGGSRRMLLLLAPTDSSHSSTHHGFLVDLEPELTRAGDEAVALAREGTLAVQRAAGFLSAAYDLEVDVAIALLKRTSSQRNVKMRWLADRLVSQARQRTREGSHWRQPPLTELLEDLVLDAGSASTG